MADPRPLLEWKGVSGAKRYRVALRSVEPNGRVLESTNVLVEGTQFRPARELGDPRAKVEVRVVAECAQDVAGVPARTAAQVFFVDVTLSCVPRPEIRSKRVSGVWRVSWAPVARANGYDVALFSADDGRELRRTTAVNPDVEVPANVAQIVLAFRPRCGSTPGQGIISLIGRPD